MMKYESKKNPGTYLLTDGAVDPKTKTLFVTMDDGKEKSISVATLKRWWTKVADETEAPETEEAAPVDEDTAPLIEAPAPEADAPEAEDDLPAPEPIPKKKAKVKSEPETAEAHDMFKELYDMLNDLYFEGGLPIPEIAVKTSEKGAVRCSLKAVELASGENSYTINIGLGFAECPVENTAATLLHQMVHIYCAENGIAETCQKGRYHNVKFKEECEARDLVVEYDRANGYAYTSASEALEEKIK